MGFVNATSRYSLATSDSFAFDVGSGANRGLIVDVHHTGTLTPTVTYNGVTVPLRNTYKHSSINEYVRTFSLPAPASGSNTLVVTFSSTTEFYTTAKAYTDVDQTTVIDTATLSAVESAGTPISTTVTPPVAGCWIGAACGLQRNATASTGLTARAGDGTGGAYGDSNGTVTSGSPYTVAFTIASPIRQELVAYAILPAPTPSGGFFNFF